MCARFLADRRLVFVPFVVAIACVSACASDGGDPELSVIDAGLGDTSVGDASAVEASAVDASAVDASAVDASSVDASAVDASVVDGGARGDANVEDADIEDVGTTPTSASCGVLPGPEAGEPTITVTVAQAADLPSIVAGAAEGTTIFLEPGTYRMSGDESSRRIQVRTDGITIRSSTGVRTDVIIDGEYQTNEIFFIQANDVTIADMTIQRAVDHLIHATGSSAGTIHRTMLHNLALYDAGEQFVKVNSDGANHYVDEGHLECSVLRMSEAGRSHIETQYGGGCYTGGIDAHGARGWRVALNVFDGIHCENGALAEHAVHFWSGSRDTLVERNEILNCARGVGFGLVESGVERAYVDDPYPGVGYIGHYDGLIRNNLIYATGTAEAYFDTGIELDQARGTAIYHNTVGTPATFSSIDYRFSNTDVEIRNNLTTRITARDGASGQVDHNLESVSVALFRDAPNDFRLKPSATSAIDQGVSLNEAGLDLDGRTHDVRQPDLGAYEAD